MSFSLTSSLNANGTRISVSAPIGRPEWVEQFGVGNSPNGNFTLSNGTGNGQGNVLYRGNDLGQLAISAGGNTTISLKGSSGEKDALNNTLNFASVKLIFIQLVTPGPGNTVRIGPNANAACANLGFNANGYFDVANQVQLANAIGWTVSAAAGNFTLTNPSASAQTVWIRLGGVGA